MAPKSVSSWQEVHAVESHKVCSNSVNQMCHICQIVNADHHKRKCCVHNTCPPIRKRGYHFTAFKIRHFRFYGMNLWFLFPILQCQKRPFSILQSYTVYWELPLTRGYWFYIGSCPSRGATGSILGAAPHEGVEARHGELPLSRGWRGEIGRCP